MTDSAVPQIIIKSSDASRSRAAGIDELAQAVRELLPDHAVQVARPPPLLPQTDRLAPLAARSSGPSALWTIAIVVPWDTLADALGERVVVLVKHWVRERFRREKQRLEQSRTQVPAHPSDAHGYRAYLPTPAHIVTLYGPRGQFLGVVRQSEMMETPSVTIAPFSAAHSAAPDDPDLT